MSKMVLTNAYVLINSVDLSDHVRSVTLRLGADAVEDTTMGADTHTSEPGLKTWGLQVTFAQDYAAAKVDATLFPLVGAAAFAVEVRPVNSARSSTNPGYNGQVMLSDYQPVGGSVGQLHEAPVTFVPAGTLSRSTS